MGNLEILTQELRKILPIFINEFRAYIEPKKLEYLENEENIPNIIQFTNKGMGAFTQDGHIYYSNINKVMFETLKKYPNYGSEPNKKLVEPEEFVNNKKDYLDYMNYCIEKGATDLDYSLDVLPHEIMHLIGSSGGVIGEGVTELRTRQICQVHRIRCAPVLHAKETELVMKLDKKLGKHTLNKYSFGKDYGELENKFDKIYGEKMFWGIYSKLLIAYDNYQKNNLSDPIEHYKAYRNLDYSPMLELMKNEQQIDID